MNKLSHKLYVSILTIVATTFYIYIFMNYSTDATVTNILFWSVMAIISETFLIVLPSGAATSVGMAVYLAALITAGPLVAVSCSTLAFLFRMPEVFGKRRHLFTYNITVTLYNISSHALFVGVIAVIYSNLHVKADDTATIIFAALLLLTLSELISIILISIYFFTREDNQRIPLLKSYLGALPSTWAVGALGLVLVFAASISKAIVVFFFIPLLLARYSFKLYFDSQKSGQETIEALNQALFVRDAYTAGHTQRVEVYTRLLATALNYTQKDLSRITRAARLHDIGKIGIPDGILNKKGALTDDEFQRIKDHAAMGAQILSNVDSLKKISEVVRQHHERPDGRGYPDGLVGDQIQLDAAVLSIADTYDAMTSDRPYREARTKEYAINELRKYAGTQFRASLVEVFISALDELDENMLVKDNVVLEEEVVYDS